MNKYLKFMAAVAFVAVMTVSFAACDDDNEETILLSVHDQPLVIESLSPAYGYPGDEFEIVGKNFGNASELIKVSLGNRSLKVLSATDDRIAVKVPSDATTAHIKISLLGKEAESADLFKVLGQPSIENVSRNWGFIGDEITFTGSLLGTKADDIKVYFGASKVMAKISDWSETSFTATVPTDATTGEIRVIVHTQTVNVPFDEFTVRQHGQLTSVSPDKVFAGDKFVVTGNNLGIYAEGCMLAVGSQKAEILSWAETSIEAVIPENNMLKAGESYALSVVTAHETVDSDINLKYVGSYGDVLTLVKNPFTVVKVGEEVEFGARNLPASSEGVTATINAMDAKVVSITPSSVTIRIPQISSNIRNAKVELSVPGAEVYSEASVNVIARSGDVTDLALVNARSPFASVDGVRSGFRVPEGWIFNENMYTSDNLILPLLYDNDFPDGVLGFWCHTWTDALHKNQIINGKMYQTVSLPAGEYEITADVAECNLMKGDLGVALGVGEGELPNLDGSGMDFKPADGGAYLKNPDGSMAYVMLTSKNVVRAETLSSPCEYSLRFVLHRRTVLNIGMTATVTKRGGNGCSFELRGLTFKSI